MMARLEEVDNALVHVDSSGYKVRLLHGESAPGTDYEDNDNEWIEMSALNSRGASITVDFTREAFREWLELMQEWVAGWPE